MQNEVFARHAQLLRSEVGDNFERPPGRTFRVFLNGEIMSAEDFDTYGNKLFVHYFVELPIGWSLASDEAEITGMTSTCRIATIAGREVANFGHPISLDLYYDINRLDSSSKDTLPSWPQIFFEVASISRFFSKPKK